MKAGKIIAIDNCDFFSLVAVWELLDQSWELVTITRLRCAIALCREDSSPKLVFPTGISPEGLWGGTCFKRGSTNSKEKSGKKLPSNQELILNLILTRPGSSSATLAQKLGITVAAVGQWLLKLEAGGSIHHRPHPLNSRTRLYYPGAIPPHTDSKAVAPTRRELPVKIYFVDPRTLQEVCKYPNR